MKKILLLFAFIAVGAITSCEGPQGPPGQNGTPGFSAESEVFEVSNVSFTAANNWFVTYGLNPTILTTDNILVYELVNTNNNIDAWSLLPQIYYFDAGQAQYNFNFSYDQFSLFLDADFDMNLLPTSFTQNKVFRIVIIPGYTAKAASEINFENYNEVIERFKIDDSQVQILTMNK